MIGKFLRRSRIAAERFFYNDSGPSSAKKRGTRSSKLHDDSLAYFGAMHEFLMWTVTGSNTEGGRAR